MRDLITGVVNEYYSSPGEAGLGLLPDFTDEVFARFDIDHQSWVMFRVQGCPALPYDLIENMGFKVLTLVQGVMAFGQGLDCRIIGKGLSLQQAFDAVRAHEKTPPALKNDMPPYLRQATRPDGTDTYWAVQDLTPAVA